MSSCVAIVKQDAASELYIRGYLLKLLAFAQSWVMTTGNRLPLIIKF